MHEPPADADRRRVLDLVAEAMEVLDEHGEGALATFCEGLGAHREAVLARLRTLRTIGLMRESRRAVHDVPERLGDFQLLERLGGGGMGVVYRARQLSLARDVALKLIRPDQLYFPGVRERFQREIAIVAKLQHEGIVRLYSYGENEGLPWFAMELVVGVSLADVLTHCRDRAVAELRGLDLARCVAGDAATSMPAELFAGTWQEACVRVIERAALALAAAHAEGVLHRDLKPSNVMLTASGRVVLLDFGLAWTHGTDRLTRSGAPLGTVHYMAPEQLGGDADAIDERTDVYALGVVLRELLTLRPAFTGTTFEVVAQRVQQGLATPLRATGSAAGRDTATVCLMAMERDRDRRYPTANALARDLRHVLERRPIAAVRPGPARRLQRWSQRHRAITAAMAVAAIALFATPFVLAWRERSLRLQLEDSNRALAGQISRADINLALAASSLGRTLQRLHDEQIVEVPDLKPFCDDVLADTDGLLNALMATNPDDPDTRMRLAETLARAGHLRWQFTDLPRTQALFRRALELVDGCTADPDRVDEVDLDVRLALIYVERLAPEATDAAYAEAQRRAESRGALATRPLAIRRLAADAHGRHGEWLLHRREARARDHLELAQRLRQAIATDAPGTTSWTEIGTGELQLAEWFDRTGDQAAAQQHLDACHDAVHRARSFEPRSVVEREEFCTLLQTLAYRLETRQQTAAVIGTAEVLDAQLEWLVTHRPTRLGLLHNWASNRERMVRAMLVRGEPARAEPIARATVARLQPPLQLWPGQSPTWRCLLASQRQLAEIATARGQSAEAHAAVVALAATLDACAAQQLGSSANSSTCAEMSAFVARHRLDRGEREQALAWADRAVARHAEAVALSAKAKIRILPDTPLRLLRAETLLQLERIDEAVAELTQLGSRLPADVQQAVPSLARWRDDARCRPFFAPAAAK